MVQPADPSGAGRGSSRRSFVRLAFTGGIWAATLALVAKARATAAGAAAALMQRPPVRPQVLQPNAAAVRTVRLTEAATRASLPPRSWLRFYRDFLTRTGVWQGHPTAARPPLRRDGRIGVVGPQRAPVREALGIGEVRQVSDGIACAANVCEMLGVTARTACTAQSCGKNSCADLNCGQNTCSGQDCARHSCDHHTAQIADIISELTANWNTPLVRELRQQFGADSTGDLARAVNDFVLKNGYAVR